MNCGKSSMLLQVAFNYEEKGRKLKLGRFFFFFSILLVISILSVISPYVPPLEHFFASCGKFFDDFWLLFGLKPTNSRNDIRILITLCFISPIVVYILSDVIVVKKKDDEE